MKGIMRYTRLIGMAEYGWQPGDRPNLTLSELKILCAPPPSLHSIRSPTQTGAAGAGAGVGRPRHIAVIKRGENGSVSRNHHHRHHPHFHSSTPHHPIQGLSVVQRILWKKSGFLTCLVPSSRKAKRLSWASVFSCLLASWKASQPAHKLPMS